LLDIGEGNAANRQYHVNFVQGDARDTTLSAETFDHVCILGNSLGYIPEPDADLKILKESRRLLKSRGWLLLDVTDGEAAQTMLTPQAWHEIGTDVIVCRQREIDDVWIRAREIVLSKVGGLIRDSSYSIRLYRKKDLAALADRAGFDSVQIHTDASAMGASVDVGCMNHRLVVTARKP
jgi:ubiquinone/menaquinone biosynthesis C-methylase UbiE